MLSFVLKDNYYKTEREIRLIDNLRVFKVKILRAYGGCLGAKSRRRTRSTAISFGEPQAGFDPEISEWGNLAGVISRYHMVNKIVI